MRVNVDAARCGCTGYCAKIAPAVFRQAGGAPAEVLVAEPDRGQWESVREAADLCPTKAIGLRE